MGTSATSTVGAPAVGPQPAEPPLEPGDRLSRSEFERRYLGMPQLKKAELVEGTVYMPSPVRARRHARPHLRLAAWLGAYEAKTPDVESYDNSSIRLDLENEPQPDLVMIKSPAKGGQTRISADDYIEGAPELAIEIVASSHAYDLHEKKRAYRRNGVREYIAWITDEHRLVWWELRQDEYQEIGPAEDGLLKSGIFPGLWLDAQALLRGDLEGVFEALRRGLASPAHRAFTANQI